VNLIESINVWTNTVLKRINFVFLAYNPLISFFIKYMFIF